MLGDPDEAWNAFAGPEYEYFKDFPFAAGLAQWDCEIIGEPEVDLIPATPDRPAAVYKIYAFGCGNGYQPTGDEVITPRLSGSAPQAADASAPLGCATIAGGDHCISFTATVVTASSTWLGNLMYGRIRIGQAGVVWPACNSGTPVVASAVKEFGTNGKAVLTGPRNISANWSLAFDQANAQGVILGQRSVYCEAA